MLTNSIFDIRFRSADFYVSRPNRSRPVEPEGRFADKKPLEPGRQTKSNFYVSFRTDALKIFNGCIDNFVMRIYSESSYKALRHESEEKKNEKKLYDFMIRVRNAFRKRFDIPYLNGTM